MTPREGFQAAGKREIAESVVTAVLCAVATALVNYGIDRWKASRDRKLDAQSGGENA